VYDRRVEWQLSLAGLLIGLLVGMTGMGGGSLMTPMLVLLFGFKPTIAIGTDIVHGAVFKSFGAAQHRRLGNVNLRLAAWMLAGSAPTSLVGVAVASWLERRYGDGFQEAAKHMLGVALALCGIGFLVKATLRARTPGAGWQPAGGDRWIALATGVAGGFVVGLTSVGSGTFFGLVLLLAFPISAATLVGTDIFHAAALLWVAGFGHLVAGNVDLHATGWLLVGSIPGVLVGGHFTVRLPDRALRVALATVLFASGVKLVDFPGANAVMLSAVAGALVAGVAIGSRRLLVGRPAPVAQRSRL
jgi:uncharacterized membrane protein YfcA